MHGNTLLLKGQGYFINSTASSPTTIFKKKKGAISNFKQIGVPFRVARHIILVIRGFDLGFHAEAYMITAVDAFRDE